MAENKKTRHFIMTSCDSSISSAKAAYSIDVTGQVRGKADCQILLSANKKPGIIIFDERAGFCDSVTSRQINGLMQNFSNMLWSGLGIA